MSTAKLRLRTFGGFRLLGNDGQTVPLALRKAEALVGYLAVAPEQTCSREALAELLWGAYEQQHARHSLRQLLLLITKATAEIGVRILKLDSQSISLNAQSLDLDVVELGGLLRDRSPQALGSVLSLYRGEFLSGLTVQAAEFEDWLSGARAKYHELALEAALSLLHHHEADGRVEAAIETATRALWLEPVREDIHRRLMHLYVRCGMRSSALFQYRTCREVLDRELNVEPDQETTNLYTHILNARPSREYRNPAGTPPVRKLKLGRSGVLAPANSSSLVGRDKELGKLHAAYNDATSSGLLFVEIHGEAGVGKTELVRTFERGLIEKKVSTICCQAHQDAQSLPSALLGPLSDALGGGLAENKEKFRSAFDAATILLKAASEQQPLVVILEDVQNRSNSDIDFIRYAAQRCRRAPVLIVATVRSGEKVPDTDRRMALDRLTKEINAARIEMNPLSRTETAELVRSRWALKNVRPPLKHIWTLSEGSPGIVVEILNDVSAQPSNHEVTLPTRIRGEILAAAARLSETARELATIASAAGYAFDWATLERASRLDSDEAAAGLQELVDAGFFVVDKGNAKFARKRFALALYDDLVPARKSVVHTALARAIEKRFSPGLEPYFETLVDHYRNTGDLGKTLDYELRAAKIETKKGFLSASRSRFRRVLKDLNSLDEADLRRKFEIDAQLGLAAILELEGKAESISSLLDRAETLSRYLDDPARLTQVHLAQGRLHYIKGNIESSYRYCRDGLAAAGRTDSGQAWHPAEQLIARAHLINSNYDVATESLDRYRDHCLTTGLRAEATEATITLAVFHALHGEFNGAQREGEMAVRLAENGGNDAALAVCLQYSGLVKAWHNDFEVAQALFDRALEVAKSRGDLLRIYGLQTWKGFAYLGAERYQQAAEYLQDAAALADQIGTRFLVPFILAWLAEAHLGLGHEAEAVKLSHRAYRLASETNQTWAKSVGSRVLARALANSGVRNLPLAERTIKSAMDEQMALGVRFEFARSSIVYAKIKRAQGHMRRSSEIFAEAGKMYSEMGMTADSRRAKTLADSLRPLPDLQL